MWCLCGCPQKSDNHNSLTPTRNGSLPSDIHTNMCDIFESRRRSSAGYVQLRHKTDDSCSDDCRNRCREARSKEAMIKPHRKFKSCFPYRKRKVFINIKPSTADISNSISHQPNNKSQESLPLQSTNKMQSIVDETSDLENHDFAHVQITNPKKIDIFGSFDMTSSPLNSQRFPRRHSMSVCTKVPESSIVTPFAIILARLGRVRQNFMSLTGATSSNRFTSTNSIMKKVLNVKIHDEVTITSHQDVRWINVAKETLEELEWCLVQLTTVPTNHPIQTDLTTQHFRRILDQELMNLAGNCKTGNEVLDYLKSFLETRCQTKNDDFDSQGSFNKEICSNSIHSQPDLIGSSQILSQRDQDTPNLIFVNPRFMTSSSQGHVINPEVYRNLGIPTLNDGKINNILERSLDIWGLQIFEFDQITNQHSLVIMVLKILEKRKLLGIFSIDPSTVIQYFLQIEMNYDMKIPYHNSVHAADVTQSVHVLLINDALEDVFTELEILAVIFACAIHDVQHPGVTNQYLINIGNDLAIMYNDVSVLENHHLAVAFRLLAKPGCNILSSLNKKQITSIRKIVIDLVLATDMSRHMTLLSDLKSMVDAKKLTGNSMLNFDNYSDRLQLLQNMIHCADLSNPTKPLPLYQEWTQRIMEEFFTQGDKERDANLDISPMCDRLTASIEKSQVSFIDFIVYPLWSTWAQLVYPGVEEIIQTLEANREWYQFQLAINQNTNEHLTDISKSSNLIKPKQKLFKIKSIAIQTHSSIEEEKEENLLRQFEG